MSSTGRLDHGQRSRVIVDVVIEPAGRSQKRIYIDRMTIAELQERVPWDWIVGGDCRAVVTFCDVAENEEAPE